MEIAAIIIAIIGLLALTQSGGSASGSFNIPGAASAPPPEYVGPGAPYPGPSTYTPTPAPAFNPPMTPSTSAPIAGAVLGGSAAVATSVISKVGKIGSAAPVVGAAIAAVAAVAAALLAAHEKRLTDAKNENAAVDQWIPVFDSFVTSVANAYNSKQINAQYAAQICQQFDQTLYQRFRSFVGQPGTAWNDTTGMAGKCDKTCTVGCCVYFGDLGPVLNNISYVLGYPTGKWGKGDPRISGRTITCPKVFPSKYSSYTRDQYSVTLK